MDGVSFHINKLKFVDMKVKWRWFTILSDIQWNLRRFNRAYTEFYDSYMAVELQGTFAIFCPFQ